MQTISELQKLDTQALQKTLAKARFDLYKIQTALRNEKNHKPSDLKTAKRYVAQILTVINSK